MFDQDAYKIPKLKKEFLVQLNDGTKTLQKITFFLNEFSRYSADTQSILEYLNDSTIFIPAIQVQHDKKEYFMIINKNEICYIIEDSVHPIHDKNQKEAIFILSSGQKISGYAYKKTPKDQSRIIDYLTTDDQFIELAQDGKNFVYLNKNYILKVIP
ncbi:MAG TPA: hypothetical protein DD381_04330 [Lentisphaeria bacterium]|nr:MAG: hypothetical protein A2X47_07320 [Lentisphaerae bacterium GWF2_38_69]HBM15559.1 hypothetical protein [Lentisphaeria bacterium]